MTDPEAFEKKRGASANWRSLKGEDAISVLLFFPSAYLLHYYWTSPLAFLGLLAVWLVINVFFRLVPPGFASMGAGLSVAALYGRAAYLLGVNIYAAVFIGVIAYPLGYLASVMAAQSLYRLRSSGR